MFSFSNEVIMKKVTVRALVRQRSTQTNFAYIQSLVESALKRQGFSFQWGWSTGGVGVSNYNFFTTNPRFIVEGIFYVNNNYSVSSLRNVFNRAIKPYLIVVKTSSQLGEDVVTNDEEGDESDIQVIEEVSDSPTASSDNSLTWGLAALFVILLLSRE